MVIEITFLMLQKKLKPIGFLFEIRGPASLPSTKIFTLYLSTSVHRGYRLVQQLQLAMSLSIRYNPHLSLFQSDKVLNQ